MPCGWSLDATTQWIPARSKPSPLKLPTRALEGPLLHAGADGGTGSMGRWLRAEKQQLTPNNSSELTRS
jgi:hypothetical protein